MRNDFRLVERIRSEDKYFDVSVREIEEVLSAEGCSEWVCEHYADGQDSPLVLKLNLSTKRPDIPISWSAALKLHGIRIDCIDHEHNFRTADKSGVEESGWHRHLWDETALNAERCKRPLTGFDGGGLDITRFVIRVASELRIRLPPEA